MAKWQRARMAASFYEDDVSINELVEGFTESMCDVVVVEGMTVGASYGGDYDAIDLLPDGYYRQFRSASPGGRAGSYNPFDRDPEPQPADRGNIVTSAMLQREVRVSGGGGGRNGGGVAKPKGTKGGVTYVGDEKKRAGTIDDEIVQTHLLRYQVKLSVGVAEFFAPRRDEGRLILRQLAAKICAEKVPPELPTVDETEKKLVNVSFWGLSFEQLVPLRACRKAASAFLTDYAYRHDSQRIAARDGASSPNLPIAV